MMYTPIIFGNITLLICVSLSCTSRAAESCNYKSSEINHNHYNSISDKLSSNESGNKLILLKEIVNKEIDKIQENKKTVLEIFSKNNIQLLESNSYLVEYNGRIEKLQAYLKTITPKTTEQMIKNKISETYLEYHSEDADLY